MHLRITPDGTAKAVYDEALDLAAFGPPAIARAGHVEPCAGGLWTADLTPTGGPVLGPFARRGEALDAEHAWLMENWIDGPTAGPYD